MVLNWSTSAFVVVSGRSVSIRMSSLKHHRICATERTLFCPKGGFENSSAGRCVIAGGDGVYEGDGIDGVYEGDGVDGVYEGDGVDGVDGV